MDSLASDAREWLLGYSSTNSFKLRLCDHWRDDALTWSVTDSLCAWLAPFFYFLPFMLRNVNNGAWLFLPEGDLSSS
jgi:hypothetical protein